jgi:CRP-like cAMP-binding protein
MISKELSGSRSVVGRTGGTLKPLPVSELFRKLSAIMDPMILRPGDKLFVAGESVDGIYLILRGKVKLYYSGRRELRVTERLVRGGEVLGLGSLFANRDWEGTAEVVSTTRAGFVRRERVVEFLDQSPAGRLTILRLLSEDVDRCYGLIRERSFAVSRGA